MTTTTTITVADQNAAYICELAAARIRGQHAAIARLTRILERRGCAEALGKAAAVARAAIGAEHKAPEGTCN